MKKVSIVVPVYKSEAFLPKLIDSVLGQSYTNFELILVDDESPDNSGKLCDDYAQKDKRILVIHKKNGGCCDARNKGLEVATGEYLMLADGDDAIEYGFQQHPYRSKNVAVVINNQYRSLFLNHGAKLRNIIEKW